MLLQPPLTSSRQTEIRIYSGQDLAPQLPRLETFLLRGEAVELSRHPGWLTVLEQGLKQVPYCLEMLEGEKTRGFLALAYVRSLLFGRFLVGLPYLNYGGVEADDDSVSRALIDRAVQLADGLGVRYLELRHGRAVAHPALAHSRNDKVHMRLTLPATAGELWERLTAKVRNQVRKGQKCGLNVAWGGAELLSDFYDVFSRNMRDLGTPVYSRRLFRSVLRQFPERAELCVLRAEKVPVAGALLLHGWGITEVPSASSLREYNSTCANMLMYWHLLERAVQRRQRIFDFGRSSQDSNTFRFKKQWGAEPAPADWQYYVRHGGLPDMRPDNPRFQRLIRIWQRLPVRVTKLIGPPIVRGIP
jgi:FemAB-related protein (PEP-CTERM system-associated)